MKEEEHIKAFNERKETMKRWALELRGIENSQRIIGDNASKAVVELLSAYLHKHKSINEGFQLNHSWFKSESIFDKMPNFNKKIEIISKMIELEKLCERLSYGIQKPIEETKKALFLFEEIEKLIMEDEQWKKENL